jgi:NAD(P)-dependent dehydrogenase (short-subunit alcohol dehydrogenase family)
MPMSNASSRWQLEGKVALVTGANSGIGEATALLLADAGAAVGALGRDVDELEQVARRINERLGQALVLAADVSNPNEMQRAVDALAQRFGRLDIVFANAGINGTWAPLADLTPDEWDNTLAVNLKGAFLTLKAALPLLKREGGSVILNASINGTRVFSNSGATAYACSKAGVVALAKMAALELARDRIRVNVICPGAIDTPIFHKTEERNLDDVQPPIAFPEGEIPLTSGSPGHAHDVAELVAFLASDAARHITGTEVWIDGGQSLLRG